MRGWALGDDLDVDGAADAGREEEWRASSKRLQYDRELVEERLRLLVQSRASGDVGEMMFALRADLLRNLGNVTNIGRAVHDAEHRSMPQPVRAYIDEVRMQLRLVAQERDLRPEEKLAFLQETRHCFGRTALLLSGGGTLGAFHIGVVRALAKQNLLPRVLAGSSVGSVVASIIASRSAEELAQLFEDDEKFAQFLPDMTFFSGRTLGAGLRNFVRTGAMHDVTFFQKRLRAILGDTTFQEAYDRSAGRILCVAVCATREGERPRLLNYLTAPHLIVWSAVAASCAFPGLFAPQPLLAKSRDGALVPWQPEGKMGARRWHDGSLEEDLPMKGLSELFNVNYFIVSQTNPHIVPILRLKRLVCQQSLALATLAAFLESEWKHRCRQVREMAPSLDIFSLFALFGQQWEGDATVVMPFSFAQLLRVASNPSKEECLATALQGEREMWPKLAMVEMNCGIEVQLDDCTRELRSRLQQRTPRSLRRGRVPSWNTIGSVRDLYTQHAAHVTGQGGSSGSAGALAGFGPGGTGAGRPDGVASSSSGGALSHQALGASSGDERPAGDERRSSSQGDLERAATSRAVAGTPAAVVRKSRPRRRQDSDDEEGGNGDGAPCTQSVVALQAAALNPAAAHATGRDDSRVLAGGASCRSNGHHHSRSPRGSEPLSPSAISALLSVTGPRSVAAARPTTTTTTEV